MTKFRTRFTLYLAVFALLLASTPLAVAQNSKSFSRVQPTTAAMRVIGGDGTRTSVLVQNVGAVNVAFGGSTVTYATGQIVAPSQQLLCVGDTDSLYAIAQSGTADLRVTATFSQGSRPTSIASCSVSRLVANYVAANSQSAPVTIATTSTSDMYFTAPVTGTLTGVEFTSLDALAASDTNFITFTVTNLGQAGVGTTVMLAAVDGNTTKVTGGTALVANARRQFTLSTTASNLNVTKGDVVRVRATATGTLANTVTLSRVLAYFTSLS